LIFDEVTDKHKLAPFYGPRCIFYRKLYDDQAHEGGRVPLIVCHRSTKSCISHRPEIKSANFIVGLPQVDQLPVFVSWSSRVK